MLHATHVQLNIEINYKGTEELTSKKYMKTFAP